MERAHKYEFEGKVRYSEIDHRATMTLPALINYFQDCSTFQSEQLGYGMDVLKKEKKAWVLAYWQVIVKRYPKLCERITVGTFASGFKGMFGNRNFYMKDESGEQIAVCIVAVRRRRAHRVGDCDDSAQQVIFNGRFAALDALSVLCH